MYDNFTEYMKFVENTILSFERVPGLVPSQEEINEYYDRRRRNINEAPILCPIKFNPRVDMFKCPVIMINNEYTYSLLGLELTSPQIHEKIRSNIHKSIIDESYNLRKLYKDCKVVFKQIISQCDNLVAPYEYNMLVTMYLKLIKTVRSNFNDTTIKYQPYILDPSIFVRWYKFMKESYMVKIQNIDLYDPVQWDFSTRCGVLLVLPSPLVLLLDRKLPITSFLGVSHKSEQCGTVTKSYTEFYLKPDYCITYSMQINHKHVDFINNSSYRITTFPNLLLWLEYAVECRLLAIQNMYMYYGLVWTIVSDDGFVRNNSSAYENNFDMPYYIYNNLVAVLFGIRNYYSGYDEDTDNFYSDFDDTFWYLKPIHIYDFDGVEEFRQSLDIVSPNNKPIQARYLRYCRKAVNNALLPENWINYEKYHYKKYLKSLNKKSEK